MVDVAKSFGREDPITAIAAVAAGIAAVAVAAFIALQIHRAIERHQSAPPILTGAERLASAAVECRTPAICRRAGPAT